MIDPDNMWKPGNQSPTLAKSSFRSDRCIWFMQQTHARNVVRCGALGPARSPLMVGLTTHEMNHLDLSKFPWMHGRCGKPHQNNQHQDVHCIFLGGFLSKWCCVVFKNDHILYIIYHIWTLCWLFTTESLERWRGAWWRSWYAVFSRKIGSLWGWRWGGFLLRTIWMFLKIGVPPNRPF